MKAINFNRSDILTFWDLTADQQADAISTIDQEQAEDTSYVIIEYDNGNREALPLDMFMRTKHSRYHGIYSTSYFSAYGVILSRCGSAAIVALLTW